MSFSKEQNLEKPPRGVVLKKNNDGTDNAKYVDLLDEDKPISGQKFACISFISPETIIKQKEMFFFEEFLKKWDLNKSMEKFLQFLNFVSFKYKLDFNNLNQDLEEFAKEEHSNLISTNIEDDYKTFVDNNEEFLEDEFGKKIEFKTSTRGLKVRGVFSTQEEAELRCKMLRQVDPNHDVYVGPVGMWMPFHPEAYKTGRVEYMEETLNQLMSSKKDNEDQAKQEFDKRVRETKEKAIEENKKKALETGNRLTQTIDKEGNLVGINNMNTQENLLESSNEPVTNEDIRKELFEGDNILTDDKNDKGLGAILNKNNAANNASNNVHNNSPNDTD